MAELKLNVPESVKRKVEESPDFNWSILIARFVELKVFERELERSERLQRCVFDRLASKSKLTEKDALELGRKVNEGIARELKERGLA